jgi:polysaccharide deacetylase 2 family uncharacterized protein YibQ
MAQPAGCGLSPELKDIDRPLGQAAKPKPAPKRPLIHRSWGVILGAAAIAIASISLVALRDDPFRTPPPAAVSAPETAAESLPPTDTGNKAGGRSAEISGSSTIHVSPRQEPAGSRSVVIRDPSSIGQNLRVAHLPDRTLIEESEYGPLPVRSADGRRPMDVYARPWSGARGARVAIVIGGLGLSQTGTQEAIAKLPAEVTLGFAPHGNSLDRWMQAARREGHEIVMQVPLEPFDYPAVDPGRNTLTVSADAQENIHNLRWVLARTTNYTGVMNYMGARFLADRDAMVPLMDELGRRGLLYLDDGSTARSLAAELALTSGVPFATGDTAIDGRRDRGAILEKLDELERIARAKGVAVGTGSAFDVTVEAVTSWVNEARKRGVEIVPISALVSDPERS